MNHLQATQYAADTLGIFRGALEAFGMQEALPCAECGGMVRLDSPVTMRIVEADGSETQSTMSEAEARQFIAESGLLPPPVLCDQHEEYRVPVSFDD